MHGILIISLSLCFPCLIPLLICSFLVQYSGFVFTVFIPHLLIF